MEFVIKRGKTKDLQQCASLIVGIYNNNELHENWSPNNAFSFCLYFKKRYPDLFLVAKAANVVLGFIIASVKPWATGNCLTIEEICVKNEYRQRGIAKSLLKQLLVHAKEHYNVHLLKGETYGDLKGMPLLWYSRIGFEKQESTFLISCASIEKILSCLNDASTY